MKTCPNCQSKMEDNFELCWNCQYSFSEEKVLGNNDFSLICPQCSTEIAPSLFYCPNCHFDLKEINRQNGILPSGPRHIDCLRCKVELVYQGFFKFHEGERVGAWGNLFELLVNRESFDLYSCPKCGKVEFFIPGFEDEHIGC